MFCAKDSGLKLSPVQLMPGLNKDGGDFCGQIKMFLIFCLPEWSGWQQEGDNHLEGQIARGGPQQEWGQKS